MKELDLILRGGTVVTHESVAEADVGAADEDICFTLALTPALSPGERMDVALPPIISGDVVVNPTVGNLTRRGNYSPSPGGEGRGEGGRSAN